MSVANIGALGQPLENEAELVRRAKARDPSVWSAWHDQYHALIYRYAYSRLGSQEDADDLASQVFLEALKSIDRYSYRGRPVLAWFYGIAHNLVSRRRRQVGRTTHLSDIEQPDGGHEVSMEDAALTSLMLNEAIARLKPAHREVLILRFLLELPTRQVAEILEKSEAATYSLQVRAVGALRRELS